MTMELRNERIDLGGGLVMETATDADFGELNAGMREEDRNECRVFGRDGESRSDWDAAYSVRLDGSLVGIVGWGLPYGASHLSRSRLLLFMTTDTVWSIRKTFVRRSREVMLSTLARLPPWVDTCLSLPMSDYRRSVRWQERVLGFSTVGEITVNGVRHTIMVKRKRKGGTE